MGFQAEKQANRAWAVWSQVFVLQPLQRIPGVDQSWGTPISGNLWGTYTFIPPNHPPPHTYTFAGTYYSPQKQFSSFLLLCSGSIQDALISTTSDTPLGALRGHGCGSHMVQSGQRGSLPMVSIVSLSSIRSWALGMSMCILRVCCCLLRVSEVRVFLLGRK